MVSAFVLIRAEPARIAELAVALADVDGVAEGYSRHDVESMWSLGEE
ncbi:MAG: hypothetical protein M3507_09955 [Actinomycetota bacterium]|jgi:hypothetical protein|nr:hypothetical protein [Actinomycetota bacterium]